ncbi:MAG: YggT family protein [Desulfomonilia bacterium]
MYGVSNPLTVIGQLLHAGLMIYLWIIIIGALISWVNPDPFNPVVRFLRRVTDPLFIQLRRYVPLIAGGIDFSPILAIALVYFLDASVVPMLIEQGNILANLFIGIGRSLSMLLNFLLIVVIVSAVISFVNPNPYNPIVRVLSALTSPLFSWFRRRLPLVYGGIDFSPLLVIVLILLVDGYGAHTLIQMG